LDQRRERVKVNSPLKDRMEQEEADRSGKEAVDAGVKNNKKGTYVWKLRQDRETRAVDPSHLPSNNSKK
jgi:hypothetical protein